METDHLPCRPEDLGSNLEVRELVEEDYHKGFVELLEQLTQVGNMSEDDFSGMFF